MPPERTYRVIGLRLKAARDRTGMSQREVAAALGIDDSTYSRYESGVLRISLPDLRQLAALFNLAADELISETGLIPQRERSPRELLREIEATIERQESRLRRYKILHETLSPASAGVGTMAEGLEEWVYTPESGAEDHDFVLIRVVGDCMEPLVMEGHRVVADKSVSPRPGDIVVADHEGQYLVKRLMERDGQLWLVAVKDLPPLKVNGHTRIEGVVVGAMYRPR